MNNKKEKNFFILLPDSVIKVLRVKMVEDNLLTSPLPAGQLLLVGAIIGLSREEGYAYASTPALSKMTTLAEGTIADYLTKLEKLDILYRYYSDGQRRIKINNKLVEKYPEIAKDVYGEVSETRKGVSETRKEVSETRIFTYYIYKIKEIISKNKENKYKDLGLINLDDEDFKKWREKNTLTYEQSKKQAFDAISNIYPVQAKTKEARVEFEKLDETELTELFESMPMFLTHVETQKEKNISANEPIYKYIEKFVNYIGKKSFKNYQKTFQEGRQFGLEEFEAFLERVKEYAYEMTEEGDFLPSPIDDHLDYRKLKIIVYNHKKGKTIEELRPYCRAITGFKEETVA